MFSNDMTIISSEQEMINLGYRFGSCLISGDVVELVGDVGAGKTTFTKGIAKALGVKDRVQSPSFTISRQYRGSNVNLIHYDFYRMTSAGIMSDEIAEIIDLGESVVVAEWVQAVDDVFLPSNYIVDFKIMSESDRQVEIRYRKENLSEEVI